MPLYILRARFALVVASLVVPAIALHCYEEVTPSDDLPHWDRVCHRSRFFEPTNCLKLKQGNSVVRNCDPTFICDRLRVRDRCVKAEVQRESLFGELCCCSTDRCNSAEALSSAFVLLSFILLILIKCA